MKRSYFTHITLYLIIGLVMASSAMAKSPVIAPSYAWRILPPLGLREESTIDTLFENYAQRSVPSDAYLVYATTGNLGGSGLDMNYMERGSMTQFFFNDAVSHWRPSPGNHTFYNTRIPMTLLSYNTAGGRENKQDLLSGTFSGNVNKRLQIGANLDYLYSKGAYANQAVKNLTWGFSGSYMGDRYELQTFFNHSNGLNQDNGGITDPLYITDPAKLQGGQSSINPKSIPTHLTASRTRLKSQEFYMNHRYKLGFWRITPPSDTVPDDTIEHRYYVPVTSFIWTMDYRDGHHAFINTSEKEGADFWENQYLSTGSSYSPTSYWSLSNTVGVSLLEGFNKYAKAGLSAYLTHEIRRFTQCPDSLAIDPISRPSDLSPYPYDSRVDSHGTQNLVWVGGQLTKQQGRILRYEATAKFGVIGSAAGEVMLDGNVRTRFRLLGDSVGIKAFGRFSNESAPYLMNNYVSNYFIWKNDFSKIRKIRFGGELDVCHTGTNVSVAVENIQNSLYFNSFGIPVQHSPNVQVLSLTLFQRLKYKGLHWDNKLLCQTTSDRAVIPLPLLGVYSNLYLQFMVARVLHVQLGVDCDFYTKYYAPVFQPATMTFCNQQQTKVGNYPFMNLYANMKLKKARFYVMMSHINQGLTGRNYFSMPGYPMNPRMFQMGVSVDFAN